MNPSSAAETAQTIIVNGSGQPTWAIFISAGAILTAATIGAFWQRRIARQTTTFNTIERQIWDADYIEARQAFIEVRDTKNATELRELASPENAKTKEAGSVRSILNNYELIALGISTGVLDETIYRRFFRGTFMTDFERVKPFIESVQSRNPKGFKEYAALYDKWRTEKPAKHQT